MAMKLVFFPLILAWVGAATWVLWDSVQRMQVWGVLWGFCAFGMAPIVVPLYIFAVIIADRPAPAWVQREREFQKEQVTKFKGMNEFERARYMEAAAGGAGTLYGGPGMRPSDNGAKLFEDAHAEALLAANDPDAAFIYLYDLYQLAVENSDPRGMETYKYYIARLPHGLELLRRATEQRIAPGLLKAGGMAQLGPASLAPAPSRPRPVASDPETAPQHRGSNDRDSGLQPGLNLERLLSEQESQPPAPRTTASVQPPRPPRPSGNPKIPF
jgi:hypothetical protein